MRPTLSILMLLVTGAPVALAGQGGVAVAGFETDGSVGLTRDEYQAIGRALTDLLRSGLGAAAAPVSLEPAVGTRPGRVDLGAARAAATAAGAKFLVVGSLLDQYGDIKVEARIIDASTGKPIAVVRGDPAIDSRDRLADAIVALTARLSAEPNIGARSGRALAGGIPVAALVAYGRGLGFESSGDRARAAESYRAAIAAAPGFSEASTALARVGN